MNDEINNLLTLKEYENFQDLENFINEYLDKKIAMVIKGITYFSYFYPNFFLFFLTITERLHIGGNQVYKKTK